jgi:hypothetical protein
MRKFSLAVILGLMLFAFSAPAFAGTYPPAGPTAVANSAVVGPGGTLTLTGQSWLPGSQVTLTLFSAPVDLGTATVAADGTWSKTVTIPASTPPGNHSIVIKGLDANGQPATQTVALTINAAGSSAVPSSSSAFAFTGSNAVGMTFIGAAVLMVGAVLAIITRRRNTARPTH